MKLGCVGSSEHRHSRSARSRPLVKITNLRAERARRDVQKGSAWRPCWCTRGTAPKCTFPARWLERPLPVTLACHLSIATAIRHLSPVISAHPIAGPLSAALPRDDGFSLLSHPHRGRAPCGHSHVLEQASVDVRPGHGEGQRSSHSQGHRTSRHITRLGHPPCRITDRHLTCGIIL